MTHDDDDDADSPADVELTVACDTIMQFEWALTDRECRQDARRQFGHSLMLYSSAGRAIILVCDTGHSKGDA